MSATPDLRIVEAQRSRVVEALAKGGDGSEVATHDWPELDPLPDATDSTPQAFPFYALGSVLGDAARAIADGVQAPDALAGGSVLAAAALAAQAHADVLMPNGRCLPLSLFIVTGALSGDRKSATDAVANAAAEEHRHQQARDHAEAMRQYGRDKGSTKKGDTEQSPPVSRSLIIGKATVEGLHGLLRNQPHIGLFTAEGGELLGGHSLREERRTAGLAWFLKAWSAETLDSLTRGDGLSILLGRRVSLHALVQPVLLRRLLADPLAQGQGFLARCLVAEPGSLAGTRKYKNCNPMADPAVQRFHAANRALLARRPVVNDRGDGNELRPRAVAMSNDAFAVWIEFYDEVERQQAQGQALAGARAFASKAAEQAARIAAIITINENLDAAEVDRPAMEGAIDVMSFYLSEHLRLTGAGADEQHFGLLRTLANWIAAKGRVDKKFLLQYAPNPIRVLKAGGSRPLLDELVQRGYIRADANGWEARP